MIRKTFKHDMPKAIIGMTFDEAKTYCLSEGYQLFYKNNHKNIAETYIITVSSIDDKGKILEAKYGF